MTNIENFIKKVEQEAALALITGFLPDVNKERPVLERLSKKYPFLKIDPEEEQKIILHARLFLNARNN
jgi:hypothetical protein